MIKLIDMVELNKGGKLSVKKIDDNNFIVGGTNISKELAKEFLYKIGYVHTEAPVDIAISKIQKFAHGIGKSVTNEDLLRHTDVEITTRRAFNSISYFDRISMKCNGVFDLTVIYNMPNAPSKYSVYNLNSTSRLPIQGFRRLEELAKWINKEYKLK